MLKHINVMRAKLQQGWISLTVIFILFHVLSELYTVGGNAAGLPCMFPFQYKNQWYSDCTAFESSQNNLWCAVETRYQNELWGYCPTACEYSLQCLILCKIILCKNVLLVSLEKYMKHEH